MLFSHAMLHRLLVLMSTHILDLYTQMFSFLPTPAGYVSHPSSGNPSCGV